MGGLLAFALASGCGLSTEGAGLFDDFDEVEGDASASETGAPDAANRPDAGGPGRDAGADADAGPLPDASPDASEAGPDAALEAGDDGSVDDPDASDGADDGDAGEDASDGSDGDAEPAADADLPDSGDAEPDAPCTLGSDPCDKDCDGFLAVECGGDDCCDEDHNVFPGQTKYFGEPNRCGNFDYDCDGTEEEYLGKGVACHNNWGCKHTKGLVGTIPSCGEEGTYLTGCSGWCTNREETRTQTCR